MFIVVEGVDKSGKTTLINKLMKKIPNIILLKIGYRPKDKSKPERQKIYQGYVLLQKKFLKHKEFNFLFDRFIISEMVYSIKRGYESLEEKKLWKLIERMKGQTVFIYCRLPMEQLSTIHYQQKDDYVDTDDLAMLQARYDIVFKKIPHILYNYNDMRDEQLFELLEKKLGVR